MFMTQGRQFHLQCIHTFISRWFTQTHKSWLSVQR